MGKSIHALLAALWLCHAGIAAGTPSAGGEPDDGASAVTPGGTTFVVPHGWAMVTHARLIELHPQEPDLALYLTEVEAPDAASAVRSAWEAADPTFRREVRLVRPTGPGDGWRERYTIEYDVSPNEHQVISAFAWRSGTTWLVGLLRSSSATAEKRAGPLKLATGKIGR